jgi:autotransporter-associated beta strand protein
MWGLDHLITGGTLTNGASAPDVNDLVIHQYNPAGALEIDSIIDTDLGLTVSGTGKVILRGANTYGYATVVNGAVLNLNADNNLGSSFENQVDINGGTLQAGASFNIDGGRLILLGDAGATIDTNGFDMTIAAGSGALSGTGSLTKIGHGTFSVGTNIAFDGMTLVEQGMYLISSINGLGANSTGAVVSSGGTLGFTGTTNTVNPIPITLNGTGYDGNGALQNLSGASTSVSPIILQSDTQIGTNSGQLTLSGVISGTGALAVSGGGTLILSGLNTYTGATSVLPNAIFEVDGSNTASTTEVNGGNIQGVGTLGMITLNSGSVTPGRVASPGVMTASSLVWNPGGALNVYLATPSNSNQLALAQSLQKGTSGSGSGYIFNLVALPAYTTSASYPLITFGSTNFSASDFSNTSSVRGFFSISGNTLFFNPVGILYPTWLFRFFDGEQIAEPAVTGMAATPLNDGVPNLLKYFCDIDPADPMSVGDRAALPTFGMMEVGGVSYLTLTYRQYTMETGVTIRVQTSTDLQNWAWASLTKGTPTATTYSIQQVGNDPNTGDPMMRIQIAYTGGKEFIRMVATSP